MCRANIAVHAEGTIPIKVSVNGKTAGSRQLTYYSMSADVVTGLSQIYLQQLVPLLDAVLLGDRDRPPPPRCLHASDVDALLVRLFVDDDNDEGDGDSPNAQQIPPQAFEQLFGVYSQAVSRTYCGVVTTVRNLPYDRIWPTCCGLLHCGLDKQAVREAATICTRPCKLTFDLLILKFRSGVRVTCDSVDYLCANFSLPSPLCSRLRPDVRDRQASDRCQTLDAHRRLMPLP